MLTPIPQYPLYSALATLLQGELVPYYLEEAEGWSCSTDMLTEALRAAREEGIAVRSAQGNTGSDVLYVSVILSVCLHLAGPWW